MTSKVHRSKAGTYHPEAGHLRRWMEDATQEAEGYGRVMCGCEGCSLCGDALAREQFEELVKAARAFTCELSARQHKRLCAALKAVEGE